MRMMRFIITLLVSVLAVFNSSAEITLRSAPADLSGVRFGAGDPNSIHTHNGRTRNTRIRINSIEYKFNMQSIAPKNSNTSAPYIAFDNESKGVTGHAQTINGSSLSMNNHSYTPNTSSATLQQTVVSMGTPTLKTYNPSKNRPFEDDNFEDIIETTNTQYAISNTGPGSGGGRPPMQGPIGDAVLPMILFVLTYVAIKRKSKN